MRYDGAMWVSLATIAILSSAQQAKPSTETGELRRHPAFESKILGSKRDVTVLLPNAYGRATARYPVLILLDGQNVFDGAKSFIPGQEWRADETTQMLIGAQLIEPIIIVAVDNTGAGRMNEYTPTKTARNGGGKGDAFGQFLTKELIPFIHKTYRTNVAGAATGIAGSSLGGLISMHLGLTLPNSFGRLGVFSPSVWWDDRVLIKTASAYRGQPRARIWLDIGTKEGQEAAPDARLLRDVLVKKGWVLGKNLAYVEDAGAEHNENAWARRFGEMLMFLYGKK